MEKTTLEQITTPWPGEKPTPEQLGISWRNCSSWRAHTGAGEKYEEEGEEEELLQTDCNPPSTTQGTWGEEKTEESGVKLILEKGKQ